MNKKRHKKTIGIDARFYGYKDGGLGRYSEMLIKYLQEIDHQNYYKIFLRKEGFKICQITNSHFQKVLVNINNYSLKEQIYFPYKIWLEKIDLMHFCHLNVPILYSGRYIVTIHDLIMNDYSTKRESTHSFPVFFIIKKCYQIVLARAIKNAAMVIAVSQFTKSCVLQRYKIKPERAAVVYEGVTLKKFDSLPERSRPTEKIIMYVGRAYPHKNLENLLRSFRIFRRRYKHQDFKLYLIGGKDFFYEKLIRWAKRRNLFYGVIFKGFADDKQLDQIYKRASLFVFPSLVEGFGLPPLEAMAHEVPVISSQNPPMPEILKNAPYYFNPKDPSNIAEAMHLVISNKELQNRMKSRGKKVAKQYDWLDMARNVLILYRRNFKIK
jgi:glycosyltransferase involved in cell wall biosynthesis